MNIQKVNDRGFTLIEIIMTLLMVGITAALAGLWIVTVANGYIFNKMNMNTTQKAQLAMTRLMKEFNAISAITASSTSTITYTRSDISSGTVNGTVVYSGGLLKINGDTLTDSVSAFILAYCDDVPDVVSYDSSACTATWSPTSRTIKITLTLNGAENAQHTFTQRVAPRNL